MNQADRRLSSRVGATATRMRYTVIYSSESPPRGTWTTREMSTSEDQTSRSSNGLDWTHRTDVSPFEDLGQV